MARGRARRGVGVAVLTLLLLACGAPAAAPASAPGSAAPAPAAAATSPASAALEPVKVAMPTIDLSGMVLGVGTWMGYYRDVGLDVELIRIGGQAAMPALLNQEVGYLFGWGATTSGLVQGAPVKVLAILLDRPPHAIVTAPDIQRPADLRGRRIAGSRAGGSDDIIIERALQEAGIRPDEVEMVRLGETSARYAGLVSNQLDATTLIQPFTAQAEQQGFRVLVRGGDVLQLPVGVVATSERQLAERPEQARRLLQAAVRGLAFLRDPANRAEAVQLATLHFQLDPALADAMVDDMLSTLTTNGEASEAVLAAALDTAREQAGQADPIPLARAVDFTLLREARRAAGLP